jgi:hypothetical protein
MTENLDTGASGAADARHLLGLVDRRVTTDVAMLSALVTDRDGGPPTFFPRQPAWPYRRPTWPC